MSQERLYRLQVLYFQTLVEKLYYKNRASKLTTLIALNLRGLAQQLNSVSIDQNELYQEVWQLAEDSNDCNAQIGNSVASASLDPIFEENEVFEQEDSTRQIDCLRTMQNRFDELKRAIFCVSEGQMKIIDRYKLELQNLAHEVQSSSKQQEEFKDLYEEERQKLSELEQKFCALKEELGEVSSLFAERDKAPSKLLQQESQEQSVMMESTNTLRLQNDLVQELTIAQQSATEAQQQCEKQREEINIKENEIGQLRETVRQLRQLEQQVCLTNAVSCQQQEDTLLLRESNLKIEKLEREISRLQQVVLRKERNLQEYDRERESALKIGEVSTQALQHEIAMLREKNEYIVKNAQEATELLTRELASKQRHVEEIEQRLAQAEREASKRAEIQEQQWQVQSEREKYDVFQYLRRKEEEITTLRNELSELRAHTTTAQRCGGSLKADSLQQQVVYAESERIKDLQNFMYLLSRDLREKEREIDQLQAALAASCAGGGGTAAQFLSAKNTARKNSLNNSTCNTATSSSAKKWKH